MLAMVRLGHEHLDVLVDDLRRSVAKEFLRSRVEGLDEALLVDGDDAVDHVIDDRLHAFPGLGELVRQFPRPDDALIVPPIRVFPFRRSVVIGHHSSSR
jgi:hypothetical protein